MKYAAIILILRAGCDEPKHLLPARHEIPTANIPASLRQANWLGNKGEGACTHAVVATLLNWQGQPQAAEWWRATHGNGETPASLAAQLDAAHIPHTQGHDAAFLELATATARGCGVAIRGGSHFATLIHLDADYAALIDPNEPHRIVWADRSAFMSEFRHSGAWALALPLPPAPPLPRWNLYPSYSTPPVSMDP